MSNIIIDIGHANGTGAKSMGYEEHETCCAIARYLREYLESAGHTVTIIDYPEMSNRDDLTATIRKANAMADQTDFGISLHCDCSDNKEAHGGHVCYVSGTGRRIAANIASHLCELMPGRADKIVRRRGLQILNQTRAPWVLVECGFISNEHDRAILTRRPQDVARAIAAGII